MSQLGAVSAEWTRLHGRIRDALQAFEGRARFLRDGWRRDAEPGRMGGHGETAILEDGEVLERAVVALSEVSGAALPPSATASRPELVGRAWTAVGVSVVVHPRNPHVPTSHANLRFFEAGGAWWFGAGFDLTPYYLVEEDAVHWHRVARSACSPFGAAIHPELKRRCDEYFFLKHRHETRGIGGVFVDDLQPGAAIVGGDFEHCFGLARAIGEGYLEAYGPIIARRKDLPTNEHERRFQLWRRGRYAEFNLVYDRGTTFGLQSGGRVEAILGSMPPLAAWHYGVPPGLAADFARLEPWLSPRDWL